MTNSGRNVIVAYQGKTPEELIKDFEEGVDSVLESLAEKGIDIEWEFPPRKDFSMG